MIFTTPEGRTYVISDDLLADGGVGIVAAIVAADRDGWDAEFIVMPHDHDNPPRDDA
jgi:hypothetical protein